MLPQSVHLNTPHPPDQNPTGLLRELTVPEVHLGDLMRTVREVPLEMRVDEMRRRGPMEVDIRGIRGEFGVLQRSLSCRIGCVAGKVLEIPLLQSDHPSP